MSNITKFIKAHHLSNDFILFWLDDFPKNIKSNFNQPQWSRFVKQICTPKTSIGADGVIVLFDHQTVTKYNILFLQNYFKNNEQANFGFYLINNDGSQAEISGNGMICSIEILKAKISPAIAKYSIVTLNKNIEVQVLKNYKNDKNYYSLGLAEPCFDNTINQNKILCDYINNQLAEFSIVSKNITYVDVGNPHLIIEINQNFEFNDSNFIKLFDQIAQEIQSKNFFKSGINIEFVYPTDNSSIKMYVIERGVGPTMACGSGATAAAACMIKYSNFNSCVKVTMPGGSVDIKWDEKSQAQIIGQSELVFEGNLDVCL